MPLLLVEHLIERMVQSGLLSAIESRKNNSPNAFQPALDINAISIASALEALDRRGQTGRDLHMGEEFKKISQAVDEVQKTMAESSANRLIKDI